MKQGNFTNFKSLLDIQGISSYTAQDVMDYIDDVVPGVDYNAESRVFIAQIVCEALGLDLTPDVLLALTDEANATLLLANAGGGKTTTTQLKVLIEKMIRVRSSDSKPINGEKVLCLVYTNSNVPDISKRQSGLVSSLYNSDIEIDGLDIDRDVQARTVHSFAISWCNEAYHYATCKPNTVGKAVIRNYQRVGMVQSILDLFNKKLNIGDSHNPRDILTLYDLCKEKLLDFNDCDKLLEFDKVNLDKDIIVKILNGYEKKKDRGSIDSPNGYIDFIDYIYDLINILENDEKFANIVRKYYDYIVADEVQDFTPVMWKLLKLIKGENTPILCVGDEDQCVYSFKGADVESILSFKDYFPNGRIHTLVHNRRCGKNIVDIANYVISHNTMRFGKEVKASREGGNIRLEPYNSESGQILNIIKDLEKMKIKELQDTTICFRRGIDLMLLSTLLEEHGIPFHSIAGEDQQKFSPYKHELYKHFIDVLQLIFSPLDKSNHINLYKVLPLTKDQLAECIGYNFKKGQYNKTNVDRLYFWDIDFSKYTGRMYDNIQEILSVLKDISVNYLEKPMNQYIEAVYTYLERYFWEYKATKLSKTPDVDVSFTPIVFSYFMSNLCYDRFIEKHFRAQKLLKENQDASFGVELSTLHKLKGLEFKNVYIINLNNEEFPNFEGIEAQNIPEEKKINLKESETRLMYVALTRAKYNLTLCYDNANPSIYISWIKEVLDGKVKVDEFNYVSQVPYTSEKLELLEETTKSTVVGGLDLLKEVESNIMSTNSIIDDSDDTISIDTVNGQELVILNSYNNGDDIEEDDEEELDLDNYGSSSNTIVVTDIENIDSEIEEDDEVDLEKSDENQGENPSRTEVISENTDTYIVEIDKEVNNESMNGYNPINFLDSIL